MITWTEQQDGGSLVWGDRVEIEGRPGKEYRIAAWYQVEIWLYYALTEIPGFLVRADKLKKVAAILLVCGLLSGCTPY